MPRRLYAKAVNHLRLFDKISGDYVNLYYRMPTEKERSRFTNFAVKRQRNQVITDFPAARLKFGGEILQGIGEGDFEAHASEHSGVLNGRITLSEGQEYVPISSDPKSEFYIEEWKNLICGPLAADLVMELGVLVFESPTEQDTGEKN